MEKQDWIRKLTSRKFWAAIADFVGMVALAFGASESTVAQVSAIIMAGAAVVAYIVGEGLIDAARAKAPQVVYVHGEDAPPDELDANG